MARLWIRSCLVASARGFFFGGLIFDWLYDAKKIPILFLIDACFLHCLLIALVVPSSGFCSELLIFILFLCILHWDKLCDFTSEGNLKNARQLSSTSPHPIYKAAASTRFGPSLHVPTKTYVIHMFQRYYIIFHIVTIDDLCFLSTWHLSIQKKPCILDSPDVVALGDASMALELGIFAGGLIAWLRPGSCSP